MKHWLLPLLVALALATTACHETNLITEPIPPDESSGEEGGDGSLSCTRPNSNNASVSPQFPGTCPAAGTCRADFTVTALQGIRRILWSFPGARGAEAEVATGEVVYPLPGTKLWNMHICTSTGLEDPTNQCCRPANGSITFTVAP